MPSIFSVGLTLIAPSNAAFIGVPETRSFSPLRLPASADGKSANVMLASIGASRQIKRPVAPKLLDIDGHANENSTPESVSLILRASSSMMIVPSSMRISENAARRCTVVWLRVSASINPDQLDDRSAATRPISTAGRAKRRRFLRVRSEREESADGHQPFCDECGLLRIPQGHIGETDAPVGNSERLPCHAEPD